MGLAELFLYFHFFLYETLLRYPGSSEKGAAAVSCYYLEGKGEACFFLEEKEREEEEAHRGI